MADKREIDIVGGIPDPRFIYIEPTEVILDENLVAALMLNGADLHITASEDMPAHGDMEFYMKDGKIWVRNR